MQNPGLRSGSAARNYPALFGRSTLVMAGHRHLATTLANVREMCRAVTRGDLELPPELAPSALYQGLLEELEEHFELEESADYFGTVEAEQPALRPGVLALRREHSDILEAISGLVIAAIENKLAGLPGPTLALLNRLEAHERAETELMSQFLVLDPERKSIGAARSR